MGTQTNNTSTSSHLDSNNFWLLLSYLRLVKLYLQYMWYGLSNLTCYQWLFQEILCSELHLYSPHQLSISKWSFGSIALRKPYNGFEIFESSQLIFFAITCKSQPLQKRFVSSANNIGAVKLQILHRSLIYIYKAADPKLNPGLHRR